MTVPAEQSPTTPSTWATVLQALRGAHHDYTGGSIDRAVLLLAIPMVLEMAMESVFAVADVFWVSRLGADAIATVGLTESMMTLVYAVAIGLSMAVTAVVARRIGEKDQEKATRTAVHAIALGMAGAVVIGALGLAFAPQLLTAMGASDAVVAGGAGFTRVLLGGSATVFLLYLINAVFRGAGDAAVAMRTLWLANGINILLGPCFVFGLGPFPRMGVTGAAVATTIGRGVGVLYQLSRLVRGGRITIGRRDLIIDPSLFVTLLRLSGSAIVQFLIGTTSWLGLFRLLATFGSNAVAGFTVVARVVMFALLPAWGLGNAAATLVGQNLGAGQPERAERSVWTASRWNLWFLGVLGALLVVLAGPIVRVFAEPAVAGDAITGLRIVGLGFPFYALGLVMTSAFNGAGDTWTPTLVNFGCFWLWEIPLAFVLARTFGVGPTGCYVAVAVAFSTSAVVGTLLFRRGRWKAKRV